MKRKLPRYICNCFEEAGYETADAICEMDDESITDLEKYIDERKDELLHCMRRNKCMSEPFKFPPGHHVIIKKFISSFKGQRLSVQAISGPPAKKCKASSLVYDETTSSQAPQTQVPETKQTVTNDIRCKVQKWVKDYNKGELNTMTEGDDYSIAVSEPKSNSSICETSISCKCGKSYTVNIGPKVHCMINNWSKHVRKCLRTPKDQSRPATEITHFFSRHHLALTGNTTLSTNEATAEEATSQSLFPITHCSQSNDDSPPLELFPTEIATESYHAAEYTNEHVLQDQSLIDNLQVPPLQPIPTASPLSHSPSPSLLTMPSQLPSEQSLQSKQEKSSTNQVF
uniref:Uncharacterized protein n=1 Tax=Amphimedon queenslandica TaxID=400682 RepID=A0A1X7TPR2_AMPQE